MGKISDTQKMKTDRAQSLANDDQGLPDSLIDDDPFDIGGFFPYIVRVYYKSVSEAIKDVYATQHSLSASEWRTLAVIGPAQKLSAREIVKKSSMDKVSVSRAVSALRAKGLMTQSIDDVDRRLSVLQLTDLGRKTYADLIPRVRKVEQQLLQGLDAGERAALLRLMAKVQTAADAIKQR